MDTDGSGQISPYEAKHLMNLIGEEVELSDVENLIAEFDLDGNGEVGGTAVVFAGIITNRPHQSCNVQVSLTEFVFVLALQRKSEFAKKDVIRCAS